MKWVSKDLPLKPQPIVYYDHMKGGVDIVDQLSSSVTIHSKNKRWPINVNFFVLDTAHSNARTLYQEVTGKKISNFEFTWQLSKALVLPFILHRYQNCTSLTNKLKEEMRAVLEDLLAQAMNEQTTEAISSQQGACGQCRVDIYGQNYANLKSSLIRRLMDKCIKCGTFICKKKDHRTSVCVKCPPV